MPGLSLPAIVEAAGRSLDGASISDEGGAITLRRGDRAFAMLRGQTLSVRLEGELARAALRTPNTMTGSDGEGWVDFAPDTLDRYATDRVAAWIEAAWRRAG